MINSINWNKNNISIYISQISHTWTFYGLQTLLENILLWILLPEPLRQPSIAISFLLCGLILFHLCELQTTYLLLKQVPHLFPVPVISWWLYFLLALHTEPSLEQSCSSAFTADRLMSYTYSLPLVNSLLQQYTLMFCFIHNHSLPSPASTLSFHIKVNGY